MTDRITARETWQPWPSGYGRCIQCMNDAHWRRRIDYGSSGILTEFYCDRHKPFVKIEAAPLPWDQVAPAEHEPGCSCCDCLESEWAEADGAYRTGRDELDHAQRP